MLLHYKNPSGNDRMESRTHIYNIEISWDLKFDPRVIGWGPLWYLEDYRIRIRYTPPLPQETMTFRPNGLKGKGKLKLVKFYERT